LAKVSLPSLIFHRENVFSRLSIDQLDYVRNGRVELDLDAQFGLIILQVLDDLVGVREHLLGVMPHLQRLVVAEYRIPVVAPIELLVGAACISLVDGDESSMAGISGVEIPRGVGLFEDDVISPGSFKEISHLQARGSGADDAVFVENGSHVASSVVLAGRGAGMTRHEGE